MLNSTTVFEHQFTTCSAFKVAGNLRHLSFEVLGTCFQGWLDCRCGFVKKREIFVLDWLSLKCRVVLSKG